MTDKPATSYDAVIVGTGIGGSTFAWALAKRGLNVAVVERGDFFKPVVKNFAPMHVNLFGNLSVIGGQTKAFGAAMYRLREGDFKAVDMEAGIDLGMGQCLLMHLGPPAPRSHRSGEAV